MKSPKSSLRGFTFVELMMALSCGGVVLAATVVSGIAMQRSFAAVEAYSSAEGDELRVLDYVALDSRRATSATVVGNVLTLGLPVYYNSGSSNAPYAPTLTSGALSYGPGSITIKYQQSGNNFTREVIIKNSAGATTSDATSIIAKNVWSFTVTPVDQGINNGTVTCSIMFFPTFVRNTGSGSWRSGSTAPTNGLGVNGDWYVIDSTATDAATVGNVYFKSAESYSLLQNVKATQVYCNAFLRNAVARQ